MFFFFTLDEQISCLTLNVCTKNIIFFFITFQGMKSEISSQHTKKVYHKHMRTEIAFFIETFFRQTTIQETVTNRISCDNSYFYYETAYFTECKRLCYESFV